MKKKSKSKPSKTKKIIRKDPTKDWPNKHQILWRPERLSYLTSPTKGEHEGECVFCYIQGLGLNQESLILKTTDLSYVVLNRFPYNNGHLMVIPKRHVADLTELTQDETSEMMSLLKQSINALRKSYRKPPDGMNVGMNLGAAGGAGIPGHLHIHAVPRWLGDANFLPMIAKTKVISETLEQTYQRLLPYFK